MKFPVDLTKIFNVCVTIHNCLLTTDCKSVDTFAVVIALLDCVDGYARYPDKVCHLTYLVKKLSLDCLSVEPF